jgi:pilus assembly protein Flp/PilA
MKIKEYDMQALVTRFANDESAATAIEYGLIAAGISVAIIAAVTALGTQIGTTMNYVSTTMSSAGK